MLFVIIESFDIVYHGDSLATSVYGNFGWAYRLWKDTVYISIHAGGK